MTPCPFCGGKPIRKLPYSDRVKKANTSLGITEASVNSGIEIDPNPDAEPHYKCNGCNRKYVDATMDINIIINNLQCEPIIVSQIFHHYGADISLTDLLTKYVVGVVRKPSHVFSFMAEKVSQRQLYVCFNCDGIRTFGTFIKETENKIEYYKMKMLGIP